MVNIGVTRNENGPVFRPSNTYTTTVEDTIPLGSNVTLLSATDADRVSAYMYLLHVLSDRVTANLFFHPKY